MDGDEVIDWAKKALDVLKPRKERDFTQEALIHRFLCIQLQIPGHFSEATNTVKKLCRHFATLQKAMPRPA